jgi:kumamolisin
MTTEIMDINEQILVSIYLRRDKHENGMTMEEYALAVLAGTKPVLSHDEYVYQFGSIADEVALVEEWATASGLTISESGVDIATVKVFGTAGKFNKLFSIELKKITDDINTYHTFDGELTVPSDINDVVENVAGLDNSVRFTTSLQQVDPELYSSGPLSPSVISSPTPLDLAKAYKFPRSPGNDQSQGKGACVAIIELGGGYTTQNLTSTFSRVGLSNPTVIDVSVDGGTNDGGINSASGEVMLDIWCTGAVAPSAKIVMYFAPNTFQGFIDTIITPTNDTTNNPSVISVSWGTTDTNWSSGNRASFESALQAAAIKGITVLVAIGDYGTKAVSSAVYGTVQYPGTSPYVISCGGSVMTVNDDWSIASERAWGGSLDGGYAGGGGVSTIFSIPVWQNNRSYSSKTYAGTVSTLTTRGVPDLAGHAVGYSFYYYSSNTFGAGFVGTSAVAPLFAGLIARINSLSGTRVGFVNAALYNAQSTAFNDITTGNNTLSSGTSGFQATSSWDACTGLGSPIGTEIYKLYKTGLSFPKNSYGFRPTSGAAYPRGTSGAR